MAADKTFTTQFLIGAKWVGGAGVQAAQRGLTSLGRHAQRVGRQFRGMTGSVFAGIEASTLLNKALSGTIQVLVKSFDAASEAQRIQDQLGLSLQRNAKRYKNTMGKSVAETTAIIEESTQALIAASEVMEQTGHDAETLQKGFAKLAATGALDPKQILEQRDAFSDVLTYISGVNATAEDSAHAGEMWADAIMRGNVALLRALDLSTGEIAQFQHINKLIKDGAITGEEGIKRRQALILKFAQKFKDETIRAFATPSGKVAQMWTQVSNLFETIGEPFIDRAPRMAQAFKDLARDIKPAADELARITAEGLEGISKWYEEHKEDIPKWIKTIEDRLKGVYDLLMLFDKIPVLIDLPKLIKALTGNVPAETLPRLKGAPPTEPSAAHQLGKAGERYREGQVKARGKSTGYPPYTPQPKAVSPENLNFYQPGGPTAMPGKIGAAAAAAPSPAVTKAATTAQTAALSPAATTAASTAPSSMAPPTPELVKRVLAEAENRKIPAAIRNRNPGAMFPGTAAEKFGTIGTQTLRAWGKTFYIAQFPTAVHGAAANFWNLAHKGGKRPYVGMTIRKAMEQWSGGYRDIAGPAGKFPGDKIITRDMTNDPEFMIPFMQAIASGEAPSGHKVLSQEQWQQAYDWYQKGAPQYGNGSTTSATPKLKDVVGGINQQRTTNTQNISMNPTINVNGVQPGREALMAKKTSLAMRDPVQQLLAGIKDAQRHDRRVGYG